MRDVRHAHLFTEVPIARTPHADRFLCSPRNLPRHVLEFLLPPRVHNLAVQLQVAHIRGLLAVKMVENLSLYSSQLTLQNLSYNKRDFSGVETFWIRVITPRAFLQEIGELT